MAAHGRRGGRAARLARGTGSLSGLVLGIGVALAIPILWVWIASKLAGTRQELTPSLAIVISTGILVSYWLALLVGSRLRRHWMDEGEQLRRDRRSSWNRSFRDQPLRAADTGSDPVERVFVIVAVIGVIAFEIWFLFFAGDPLPSGPAF
jgi:hypothetical protein